MRTCVKTTQPMVEKMKMNIATNSAITAWRKGTVLRARARGAEGSEGQRTGGGTKEKHDGATADAPDLIPPRREHRLRPDNAHLSRTQSSAGTAQEKEVVRRVVQYDARGTV